MKLLKIVGKNIPVFTAEVVFDFTASQRVTPDDAEQLTPLFGNFYLNPVNALVGINASGKTRSLVFISFVISLLRGDSLNGNPFLFEIDGKENVSIESYFYVESKKSLYRLSTCLKAIEGPDGKLSCRIQEEHLWKKGSSKVRTKTALFDFDGCPITTRNLHEEYLPDDVSFVISLSKAYKDAAPLFDLTSRADSNPATTLGTIPSRLLMFLDPSIERLEIHGENDPRPTLVKFKWNDEPIALKGTRGLNRYLSSGTIKGLSLFSFAFRALNHGGFLLVDEIENHFNSEIVKALIRFFLDKKVNIGHGMLIYSTHLPALLDESERNDSVTILRHDKAISADKLSNLLDRNDLKKSDVYESDYLHGTAPSYEKYILLRKWMMDEYV